MRSIFKEARSSNRRQPPTWDDDDMSAATNNTRRRQQMSFLRYGSSVDGTSKPRRSESSMHKSREHARQIAMKMSQDRELASPVFGQSASNSKIAAFADFSSAFGQSPKAQQQQQQQHFQQTHVKSKPTPPPASQMFSRHGSSGNNFPETQSVTSDSSSSFFEQDPFASAAMPAQNAPQQQQPQRGGGGAASHRRRRSANREQMQNNNVGADDSSSSFIADWSSASQQQQPQQVHHLQRQQPHQQQQQPQQQQTAVVHIKQHSDGSYHRQTPQENSSQVQPKSNKMSSAAARRRVRTQMRSTDAGSTAGSAASSSSVSVSLRRGGGNDIRGADQPNKKGSGRLGSFVSSGNRQHQQSALGDHISATGKSVGSARSVTSSVASNGLDMSFFDQRAGTDHRPGFSFDAFGLDASQMNDQFNQAVHDLAGSHPEISPFFSGDEFDNPGSHNKPGGWDSTHSSPTPSRASTPPIMMMVAEEGEQQISANADGGFVDGFRVTSQQQHRASQRQGHSSSPSNSITSGDSSSQGHHNMNAFKEKAGFARSKSAQRPHNSSSTSMQPNKFAARTSRMALQHQQSSSSSIRSKENIQFVDDDAAPGSSVPDTSDEGALPPTQTARSDVGASDMRRVLETMREGQPSREVASDVGFVNSEAGAPSEAGTGVTVASDICVNSDVDRPRPSNLGPLDEDDIPMQVISKDKSPTASSTKSLRNTAKGSEDTSTTVSTNYSSPYEEKKEEQDQHHDDSGAPLTQEHIDALQSRLSDTMEMRSPEMVEERRKQELQEKHNRMRLDASQQEENQNPTPPFFKRTSPRNQHVGGAKSDGGANPSTELSSAVDRLNLSTVRSSEFQNSRNRARSEAGGASAGPTPEFFKVKLRSTKSGDVNQENVVPANVSLSHDSHDPAMQKPQHSATEQAEPITGRNMTYRERREMELKQREKEQIERERQEQEQLAKEQQQQEQYEREQYERERQQQEQYEREQQERSVYEAQQMQQQQQQQQLERERQQQEQYEREQQERSMYQSQQSQQQEQQYPQEKEVVKRAERDVASLIQRRIAANRRSAQQQQKEESSAMEDPSVMPMPSAVGGNAETGEHPSYEDVPALAPRMEGRGIESLSMPGLGVPPASDGLFEQTPMLAKNIRSRPESQPQQEPSRAPPSEEEEPPLDPRAAMMKALQSRGAPMVAAPPQRDPEPIDEQRPLTLETVRTGSNLMEPATKSTTPKATKMMLNAFLAGRGDAAAVPVPKKQAVDEQTEAGQSASSRPALKDDPDYARYFKMLKLGMPMEVVKHALERDGMDPTVMDGDHNKPVMVGVPLKDDPDYQKYFKMLKIGMPMDAVKHSMERDGLDGSIMDQDHNLPLQRNKKKSSDEESQAEKDSHRRARLHWKTLRKVTSNSLWAKLDQDEELENIEIDETEFQELFQAEKGNDVHATKAASTKTEKSSSVRVIDPKRANNGGIILARLKMSHDDMADAVDRINENALAAEQIENIIEYLPTKEERKALEAYMLEGGQDAAEKFDGLCECEKFMVSMMTVKHARQKVRALLFKLQFEQCLDDILQDTLLVETACDELSSSVRLRQLLGIVLTFGNRLNTAGNKKRKAGAFTLDSLLKLSQAKAFDKKTTFLHYVVLIVQRNNETLLRFQDDLEHVFKADKVFWDQCLIDLDEVESQLENVRRIALHQARQAHGYQLRRTKKKDDDDDSLSDAEIELSLEEEVEALRATPIGIFTLSAIKYVSSLRDKVDDTRAKYRQLLEYFGEEEETMPPHELFTTLAKFCRDFEKAKEAVSAKEKKKQREDKKRASGNPAAGKPPTHSTPDRRPQQQKTMLRPSSLQPSISEVMQQDQHGNSAPPSQEESEQGQTVPPSAGLEQAQYSQSETQVPLRGHGRVEPNSRRHLDEYQNAPSQAADDYRGQTDPAPMNYSNNAPTHEHYYQQQEQGQDHGSSNHPYEQTRQYHDTSPHPSAQHDRSPGQTSHVQSAGSHHTQKSPGRERSGQMVSKSPGRVQHLASNFAPSAPIQQAQPQHSGSGYNNQRTRSEMAQPRYQQQQRSEMHHHVNRPGELNKVQQNVYQHPAHAPNPSAYQNDHGRSQIPQHAHKTQQYSPHQSQQSPQQPPAQSSSLNASTQKAQNHWAQQNQRPQQADSPSITPTVSQESNNSKAQGNAAVVSLRQKARMKTMHRQRGPPNYSNSAPPDQGPETRSHPPANTPPQQQRQQPQQQPMSPRSSFRHRKRMEVRERMRQERTQGQN